MAKKVVFWSMNIIFYIIYFLLFDYIIGRRLPISTIWNIFSLFVLTVINIPLAVATTGKVFSTIEESDKD